jgi:hypothetical protein
VGSGHAPQTPRPIDLARSFGYDNARENQQTGEQEHRRYGFMKHHGRERSGQQRLQISERGKMRCRDVFERPRIDEISHHGRKQCQKDDGYPNTGAEIGEIVCGHLVHGERQEQQW